MAQGKDVFMGLNLLGVVVFVLLLFSIPFLCWLPFMFEQCMAAETKS